MEDAKLLGNSSERRDFHITLTTDQATSTRILSILYPISVYRRDLTGATELRGRILSYFLPCLFASLVLLMYIRYSSHLPSFRQNYRFPNFSRNFLELGLNYNRFIFTERWTWCTTITRFTFGEGEGGEDKKGERGLIIEVGILNRVW